MRLMLPVCYMYGTLWHMGYSHIDRVYGVMFVDFFELQSAQERKRDYDRSQALTLGFLMAYIT